MPSLLVLRIRFARTDVCVASDRAGRDFMAPHRS